MLFNDELVFLLFQFFVELSKKVENTLEKYDITLEQSFILSDICHNEGVTLSQLSKNRIYKALFYRNIDYLHKQKMISKRHGRKYKKFIYLHPTAYGETVMEDVEVTVRSFLNSQNYDKRNLKCLNNLLKIQGEDYD